MNLIDIPITAFGLFIGLLLWSRMVHISYAVYGALKKVDVREHDKDLTDAHIKKLLRVVVAASCVWVLAFGTIAYFFSSGAQSGWAWFFGGAAATPALIAKTTRMALHRIKKLREQRVQL